VTDPILSLKRSAAAHSSWARTPDRAARTLAGRAASLDRFYNATDPALPTEVRAQMAESARKAFYKSMAAKSVAARRAKGGRRAAS
jgi:hypothetical protein